MLKVPKVKEKDPAIFRSTGGDSRIKRRPASKTVPVN